MARRARSAAGDALSRERIIETAIALLDASGEGGLTFRALSERLATGPGAIYWHIASKDELLTAACDAIIARATSEPPAGETPAAALRGLAIAMFDATAAHPWVGAALTRAAGQLPGVRVLERIGQQVRALGVPPERQWTVASALLNYILGVAGQHAANMLAHPNVDRPRFLGAVADAWLQLDPEAYPFTRSVAGQLPGHDDRADFLAGIDLILGGIQAP